jgi:RNA polymerase sigma-70 factor (ECF subfamily)
VIDVKWLIGVARHKLADHWRAAARDRARVAAVENEQALAPGREDPWEGSLDRLLAAQTLQQLAPQHRLVLTLRYVDDLPVAEVAETIGRSVHATEGVLVRARSSFRRHYPRPRDDEGGSR